MTGYGINCDRETAKVGSLTVTLQNCHIWVLFPSVLLLQQLIWGIIKIMLNSAFAEQGNRLLELDRNKPEGEKGKYICNIAKSTYFLICRESNFWLVPQ